MATRLLEVTMESQSRPGLFHTVTAWQRNDGGVQLMCTCEAFVRGGLPCYHVEDLDAVLECAVAQGVEVRRL